MSAPHSQACDADDCPCFLSGQDSMRASLAERQASIVEAMTDFVELLTAKEHVTDAEEGISGHALSVGPDGIYRRCSCGLDFRTWAEAEIHVKQAAASGRSTE